MDWSIVCPACGGPAVLERDWAGEERVRCDAYRACRPEVVDCIAAEIAECGGVPGDPYWHEPVLYGEAEQLERDFALAEARQIATLDGLAA